MWENIFIQGPNKKLHVFCWAERGHIMSLRKLSSPSAAPASSLPPPPLTSPSHHTTCSPLAASIYNAEINILKYLQNHQKWKTVHSMIDYAYYR